MDRPTRPGTAISVRTYGSAWKSTAPDCEKTASFGASAEPKPNSSVPANAAPGRQRPKISAVDHIARLEAVGRGASMGALGTIRANGDFELALTIRTFAVADGRAHLWVGGGVVWDSDPDDEVEESWVKARPLLAAIGGLVAA